MRIFQIDFISGGFLNLPSVCSAFFLFFGRSSKNVDFLANNKKKLPKILWVFNIFQAPQGVMRSFEEY